MVDGGVEVGHGGLAALDGGVVGDGLLRVAALPWQTAELPRWRMRSEFEALGVKRWAN